MIFLFEFVFFNDYSRKSELTYDEWAEFLTYLCRLNDLEEEKVIADLINCGLPEAVSVVIPKYREFFKTYRSKKALVNVNDS